MEIVVYDPMRWGRVLGCLGVRAIRNQAAAAEAGKFRFRPYKATE